MKFYEKVLSSMKKTKFTSNEWIDLWNSFWEKEKGNYIKQKRPVMSQTWDLEDDVCEGEGEDYLMREMD